jgi:hypothetical protein
MYSSRAQRIFRTTLSTATHSLRERPRIWADWAAAPRPQRSPSCKAARDVRKSVSAETLFRGGQVCTKAINVPASLVWWAVLALALTLTALGAAIVA